MRRILFGPAGRGQLCCGQFLLVCLLVGVWPSHLGATEICTGKFGLSQKSMAEVGATQIGSAQVGSFKVGAVEVGLLQIGMAFRASEVRASEFGIGEVDAGQSDAAQVAAGEVDAHHGSAALPQEFQLRDREFFLAIRLIEQKACLEKLHAFACLRFGRCLAEDFPREQNYENHHDYAKDRGHDSRLYGTGVSCKRSGSGRGPGSRTAFVLSALDRLSSAGGLPSGFCGSCDRQVLLASGEQSGWACVHCEAEIATVSLVAEEEISTLGYGILEEPKAGCATGCGSGGCGVGSAQTRPS